MIITRFAPSPTGNLHIGGARTALFNYLFAKASNGKFLLRIDDTDQIRSDIKYINDIKNSLQWLGLTWDNFGEEVYQSSKFSRYLQIAENLVNQGRAYRCYASPEESEYARSIEDVVVRKEFLRNLPIKDNYTIRFKMLSNRIECHDTISGSHIIDERCLDDFVMIRQDKTPTYMLASVVDDEDMQITHIIRAKEHLANTYRQLPLIYALNYNIPVYSHVPLIHNQNGEKLSKRHGAASVFDYKELGIMPEALCNYLLRLGWGHSDTDIISMEDAIKIFSLDGLRSSPAKTDMDKLSSINSYYMKHLPHNIILDRADLSEKIKERAKKCIENLCEKATSINYIKDMCNQIFNDNIEYKDDLPKLSEVDKGIIGKFNFNNIDFSSPESIKKDVMEAVALCESKKNILMFLRIAITGMKISPGLFEIIYALEKNECQKRLDSIKYNLE